MQNFHPWSANEGEKQQPAKQIPDHCIGHSFFLRKNCYNLWDTVWNILHFRHRFHYLLNLRIGSKSSFFLSFSSRFGLFLEVRSMDYALLSFRKLSVAFLTTPRSRIHSWTFMEYVTTPFQFNFLMGEMITRLPHFVGHAVLLLSLCLAREQGTCKLTAINNNEPQSLRIDLVHSRCSRSVRCWHDV